MLSTIYPPSCSIRIASSAIRYLLYGMMLSLAACVSNPALDKSEKLLQQGKKVAAFDTLYAALANASDSDKKAIKIKMQQLAPYIAPNRIKTARHLLSSPNTIPDLQKAVHYLTDSVKYDYQNQISTTLKRYKKELRQYQHEQQQLLSKITTASSENNWNNVFTLLKHLKRINPAYPHLPEKYTNTLQQRKDYYQYQIEDAIYRKDWQSAQTILTSLSKEIPPFNSKWLRQFSNQYQNDINNRIEKNIRYLISRNKYFKAYILLKDTHILSKDKLLFQIKTRGVNYYINKARQFMALNNDDPSISTGKAYIFAYKAIQIDSYNQEAFSLHRDLQDAISKKIKIYIAISTFGSPQHEPESGTRFSDSLIAYLSKNLPYSIEIMERSKVDVMLQKYEQSYEELSKQLGLELFIIGNISTLSVERQQTRGKQTIMVEVGERQEANPEYQQYMNIYGSDVSKWPRYVTPTINRKMTEAFSYNVGEEKVNGLMTASVRLFDTKLGAITKAEIFKSSFSDKDTFHDAVSSAGILYDPLDLPTNNNIKDQMTEDLIRQVAKVILANFKDLEKDYWSHAKENINRREQNKALQFLAEGLVYCLKNHLPKKNVWFDKIYNTALLELTD